MVIPVILSILAAFLYASTNHIDKFLISKAVKHSDYRALLLVSTVIAGGVMSLIYLFVCGFQLAFDLTSILFLLFNSVLYTIANLFWFKSLDRDDTTVVVIMLQLIPVFMLFLSPILLPGQTVSLLQFAGGMLITLAAIFVTYEPKKKKFDKNRLITLGMMTFTSFAYAIWFISQRYVNQNHDFNQTILWQNITLLAVGIIMFLFLKSYRNSFQRMLKHNGVKVIGLNLINELFNSFGGVVTILAGTMTSVALVSFVQAGVQPFAVMLIGIIITKLFPKIEKEKITKSILIRRTIMIIICVIGLACIEFG